MDSCQLEINTIDKEVEALNRELKSYKRWFRFWKTKAEKEIHNKIKIKKHEIKNLSHEYNRLKGNMFYTSKELTVKAKQFLAENGFKKIDTEVYNSRYTETYSF